MYFAYSVNSTFRICHLNDLQNAKLLIGNVTYFWEYVSAKERFHFPALELEYDYCFLIF